MGMLERLVALLQDDVREILDRAEDAEKLVDRIFHDMTEALREARAQVRSTSTEEMVMEANLQRARELERQWEAKAALAVAKGRDDLAREALRRKVDYGMTAQTYEKQLRAQRQMVAQLQADLRMLEAKYEALLRRRDILVAQYKTAKAQERVGEVARSMSTIDSISQLARIEDKIRDKAARAQAQSKSGEPSLDEPFGRLAAK